MVKRTSQLLPAVAGSATDTHMEQSIFYQLSIVLAIAAGVSLIAKFFRQPLIIGYIITGIIVGPSLLGIIHNHEAFESFSQIGIALLLFIIGLGLNVAIIKNTGKPVLITFLVIIAGIGSLGLITSLLLGFNRDESIVMATALLFSSTIIVVKSLSDKKEQSRLYGQIAIGILLAEDLFATIALVFVAAGGVGGSSKELILLLVKAVFMASMLVLFGGFILPRFTKLFASSQELLYVFALAWAFGMASISWWLGFSIEVGALFAGVTIAHLPYAQAISTKLKPLRDFFIVLFFIKLGEELGIDNLAAAIIPALIFSALVLIGKPLLIMTSLGLLGYTKQTNFKAAVHLSQISEFSIILVVLAGTSGLTTPTTTAIITLTALITIATSAYLMKYDDPLFRRFQVFLGRFERGETKRELRELGAYTLVLIGYHEGGYNFVKTFRKMKKRYIVVDYNPEIIEALESQHINHLYGDATDPELLDEIGIHKSELIISTITDAGTNKFLVSHITTANKDAIFICHAANLDDAEALYEAGASYVLMQQYIGDEKINDFIGKHGSNKNAFTEYKHKHRTSLGELARR